MSGDSDEQQLLGQKQIMEAFEELARLLEKERVRATLYMVGGSAMAVGYGSSRQTKDVDVLLKEGSSAVFELARRVAQKHGLPSGWLNDCVRNAKGFPPKDDANALRILNSPNLVVTSASRSHLIAMKAHAGRELDLKDLRLLLMDTNIRTLDEVKKIHNATFPYDEIPRENIGPIEDLLADLSEKD